ncbi:MAG: hypothetical protein FJ087_14150 [Deltaproteobacteria bacterium]|nr:hypothetical protein [Deltaproteobacteria bacterium]
MRPVPDLRVGQPQRGRALAALAPRGARGDPRLRSPARSGRGDARRLPRRSGPRRRGDELVHDLRRLGVRVAATPFPVVSMEDAARLRGAALSVLSPDASWEQVYAGLLDGIGVPSLPAPAPYGFAGTSAFLAAVAAALGLPDVARRAARPRGGRTRERFDRLREQAADHRIGIVCEAARVARVRDPRLHWGVPLAPTLEELGFDVRVAAAGPANGGAAGADRVSTAAELREWLRDTRIAAVYTDYAFDARLADAGVAPFGLGVFEMGFAGAVRTQERLLRRCRMGFFRLGAAGGA